MDLQAFNPSAEITDQISQSVESTLLLLGENPEREGLKRTPHRVGKSLQFLVENDTVTEIGSSAFEGCTSLVNCTLPDSVNIINNGAFKNCSAMEIDN